MRPLEKRKPVAGTTGCHLKIEKPSSEFDDQNHTLNLIDLQAARLLRRFNLTPPRARLICHLAGLGGAA
ncbi:MAG: hypothetical protein WBA44_11615 [Mesorhizobium sp.]